MESEVDAVLNGDTLQSLSDYDEYSMLNVNITSLIDRLDQDVADDSLLPNKFECGDGVQFVNRVFGGDFTSISEFPWYDIYYDSRYVARVGESSVETIRSEWIRFEAIIHFLNFRMALLIYNTNSSEFSKKKYFLFV